MKSLLDLTCLTVANMIKGARRGQRLRLGTRSSRPTAPHTPASA